MYCVYNAYYINSSLAQYTNQKVIFTSSQNVSLMMFLQCDSIGLRFGYYGGRNSQIVFFRL